MSDTDDLIELARKTRMLVIRVHHRYGESDVVRTRDQALQMEVDGVDFDVLWDFTNNKKGRVNAF